MDTNEFKKFVSQYNLGEYTLMDIVDVLSYETKEKLAEDLKILRHVKKEKASKNDSTLYIFTDGACVFNGNKGGQARAAYAVCFEEDSGLEYLSTSGKLNTDPTNQRAELKAIKKACEIVLAGGVFKKQKWKNINICTDSEYSINCITKWSKAWEKNGWKTKNGQKVKNEELIKAITGAIERIEDEHDTQICFTHVYSHTTPPSDTTSFAYRLYDGNRKADLAARKMV